jgi:two-component system phosphate regulon sensor histidine kinase PhoR
MPIAWRKLLVGLLLLIAAGGIIGWLYGRPVLGLLIAALAALVWQVRQLLAFDRALRTDDFDSFRHGEGIWQQIFARFAYERDRSQKHKNRYRDLLREIRKSTNAMPDAAVIIDANNEIVTCNKAAKRLAGLKPKKDRGQRVDNILREPALTALLQDEKYSRSVDIVSPVHEGDWLNCRVVPYGADQKLLLLRDITERITLNKMRRDFVANASHELRSPLTVISGYLDSLAEDESIPADWAQPIEQMRAQAQRMNRVVAELLELSRLESGGRAATDNIVDVPALLDAARRTYAGRQDVPTIAVDVETGLLLRGNSSQIESVVNNLLSNAVRHTEAGGEVVLTWRSRGTGGELVVADTGEGIPAEQIPRLTERFFRVDRGRSRDDGGVGLGLAIVKHALGRHEAELLISSDLGAGSEFTCRFPPQRVVMAADDALASKAGTA